MTDVPPNVVSIAGSDPSGGAGVQADLKTFSALGAYGTTVVTSLTAQSTRGVSDVHPVPSAFVASQWRTLVDDVRLEAAKIGMLGTADVVDLVGSFLDERVVEHVVLDPVMVATSGDRLLDEDAVDAVRRLLPRVSLVTPNVPEAAVLLGLPPAQDVAAMVDQAEALLALGARRVLLKGGHHETSCDAVDVLAGPEGTHHLQARRVATTNTHGTGCSLSSALAALRPRRRSWLDTAAEAKEWLTGALAASDRLAVGGGSGPVHHLYRYW